MKKIAVVCLKYPPVYSGFGNQAEAIFQQISNDSSEFDFTILTGKYPKTKFKNQPKHKVLPIGIKKIFKKSPKIGSIFFSFACFHWLLKNSNKYNIIHCIGAHGPSAIPSVIASLILRKKLIIKITQAEYRPTLKKLNFLHYGVREIRKKIVSKSSIFIAISKEIEEDLKNYGIKKEKIVYIPNGGDEKTYHPLSSDNQKKKLKISKGIKKNSIVLLYAGALNKRKGIHDLLYVLKTFNNFEGKELEVILCGPDYDNIYQNFIKDVSFPMDVKYMGSVNDLQEYYQLADVFIFPSYSEGLPNVLIEASLCGLVPLASNIGGNNDIVKDNISGMLFPPGDKLIFKEKLIKIINDEKLRKTFSENVLNSSIEKFSIKSVAQKYKELYDVFEEN